MSGNKTTNQNGIFGTKGIPDMVNYPGSRYSPPGSWTDTDGNLWLFGGSGYPESGNSGRLNDLWRFNITSKEWAWMSGSNTTNQKGEYGTKGVPDMANYPGARFDPVSWTDTDGNLWLFGGDGIDESDDIGWLNDLWRFTITSNEWTWMSGSNTTNQKGEYGTKGVLDGANCPGARDRSVSWTDTDGDLWLFGGFGFDESGDLGFMNDLWRFDCTKEWYPWYPWYPDDDGGDDDQGEDENGIISIIIIIFGIGSVSGIAATSLYYNQHRKKNIYYKPQRKKKAKSILKGKFHEYSKNFPSTPSSKELLKELPNKNLLRQIFDTKKTKRNDAILDNILDNIDLTAVSDEFLRKLDLLNVEDEEKREFLKEMLHFSPKERNEILDKILKRLNS